MEPFYSLIKKNASTLQRGTKLQNGSSRNPLNHFTQSSEYDSINPICYLIRLQLKNGYGMIPDLIWWHKSLTRSGCQRKGAYILAQSGQDKNSTQVQVKITDSLDFTLITSQLFWDLINHGVPLDSCGSVTGCLSLYQ